MDLMSAALPFWIATALAIGAGTTAFVIASRRTRIVQQANALALDIEALNDRLWALADSEERYRSLVEAQGDLIVRRDAGRIIYANAAYAALLGVGVEAASGSEAQPQRIALRPADALDDGTRIFDECIADASGQERWISWVETVVPVASGHTVLQRVGRDITARIAGELDLVEARARAESASEAKSRFLATVSHEFRTPLNGILGMADLLDDTRLDLEQSTYVDALRNSGEALLALVDDILDVAKVEAGKLELASDPFDLGQLTETVTELMAPRAQAKGLDIATFISPSLPNRLIGDRDRIRQILLNLAGNAIKFTDRGGVGIRIDYSAAAGVTLSVADTGAGIPADRLQAIFEEFEQGDSSATRRHEGTGLGLAIVRRLARLMGGEVTVESEPGQGARFCVTLPLPVPPDAITATLPVWAGKRALIVSDGHFGGSFLAETIMATEAAAVLTASPDEARALLGQSPGFDAVLVDLTLGADARGLAAAAIAANVAERLVMLSPSERRTLIAPRESGFSGFLIKPIRARSLYERLSPKRVSSDLPGSLHRPLPAQKDRAPPRLTVLVAEDNDINALLATRTLERLGCAALWARDGREALAMVEASLAGTRGPLDLVLLDIRMPELDGLATARAIRALERGHPGSPLPLIAVTANAAASDRAAALAAGMDDCLAKPLERAALEDWLDRVEKRGAPALTV